MATLPRSILWTLLFVGLVFAWGGNYPIVRVGLENAPPLWLATFRAGTGLGAFALYLLPSWPRVLDARGKRDALLLGVLNFGLFFGLWFVAAKAISPGITAVLVYTFPLWVAVLSAPLLGHRLRALEWSSVALGFLGIVLVSEPWTGGPRSLDPVAIVELLGAALAWAAATVLVKRRFTGTEVKEANLYQLAGGAAALLAASLLTEPTGGIAPTWSLLGSVLYMGLIGTAFAYAIWFSLLDRFRASTISAYVFLVPVVALFISALFFGERLSLIQAAGVAMVLASIYGVAQQGPLLPIRAKGPTERT